MRGELHSTEVDLLTRSGSVADRMANDLLTPSGKPSCIEVQSLIKLTCEVPPLKRERCISKMELSLIISTTVIVLVKRSSKYSAIYMVHREDGVGRPPWTTA